jgi:hypothetical protein
MQTRTDTGHGTGRSFWHLPRRTTGRRTGRDGLGDTLRFCAACLALVSWVALLVLPGWAAAQAMSTEATAMLHWVLHSGDNEGASFVVIDKRQARLWLYDPQGRALGNTPVLLGLARGDASVPGIGERAMEDIRKEERTTPAGRFIAEPGRNASGEDIFWIDYDAAVSMHRVRASNPKERRLQRLATATVADNRISYGCINVPAAFYEAKILPLFRQQRGVVYILPEKLSPKLLFTPPVDRPGRPLAAAPAAPATPATIRH